MDILRRLEEMRGAARRGDLVAGWSDRQDLARLVEAGRVVDHGGGCYSLAGTPEWIVRARQFRGLLTCVSWAEERGLAVLDQPRKVHLAVPSNRGAKASSARPSERVVLHRTSALGCGSLPEPPIAPPAVALASVLRCQPARAAIATVDSALHAGVCAAHEIRAELANKGSVAARDALARCNPRSESLIETLSRLDLEDAGLDVEVGVHIPGVGWVDIVVEGRVVVELDGFAFHTSRAAFGNDRRRDRALAALGYTVLRFTYEDVVMVPGTVLAGVLAALEAPSRRWA